MSTIVQSKIGCEVERLIPQERNSKKKKETRLMAENYKG